MINVVNDIVLGNGPFKSAISRLE